LSFVAPQAMGRRHFTFGPATRAMQASIQEGGIETVRDPSSWMDPDRAQSRRHFPSQEATRGGTADCLEIYSKRHCPPPAAEAHDGGTGVRRFDAVEHKQNGREAVDPGQGRRHVPAPSGQLDVAFQVKARESRRCRQPCEEPTSRRAPRPDSRTQRRYIKCQDHLQWGGAVPGQFPDSRPQGIRCSLTSPTYVDTHTAAVLSCDAERLTPTPQQAVSLVCFGPRSQTPRKRRVEVQDSLVGGTLRGPAASLRAKEAPKPSRRPANEGSSLLGGCLRSADVERAPSPSPQLPRDNLEGGACLPVVRAH